MKKSKILFCLFIVMNHILFAQTKTDNSMSLSPKERSIVSISAFAAQGNMPKLQIALNDGLDVGLTISEVKEMLVQLYAYAGFPRSLNALNMLMTVLDERKKKGINDELGKTPSPLPTNKTKLQSGTEIQTKLVGQPVKGAVYEFAPAIDQFLKEHLFGDIFGRDNLDFKTREIVTIAALASLGGAENQLRSHFSVGMHNGITEAQLNEIVSIIQLKVGSKEGITANTMLQIVLNKGQNNNAGEKDSKEASAAQIGNNIFPRGEKITNNNFIGNTWLQQLVTADSLNNIPVGNVTFEPGARTNWHLHPGGQILLITGGTGYYQEKGSAKKIIQKGNVVTCPPNVPHWHGASKDDELIQIAITNMQNGPTVWMHPVSEEEYNGDN